jgi:hypothetical protein
MDLLQKEEFHDLSYYTLGHPDPLYFIHQHAVDAYHAQTADKNTKPITLTFSLIGLYLYLEKKYTGKQVQLAHMTLAKNKKDWTMLELPLDRGLINVSDVLKAAPGNSRDLKIREWCLSVWAAYKQWHETISTLAKTALHIDN